MSTNSIMVDVLVCTRDGGSTLPFSLGSLSVQEFRSFRVIIRDESQAGSVLGNPLVAKVVDLLTRKGIAVTYCRDWQSRGIAFARHSILQMASDQFVWFVDDDTFAEPDCLSRLVSTMQEQHCGYVQGAKVSVDNCYGFENYSPEKLMTVDVGQPRLFAWYEEDRTVPVFIGDTANILFDREKLLAVGGFGFFEEVGTGVIGEDWIAAALVADQFGGVLRTGAVSWHIGKVRPASPFTADRMFVIRFLKGRVSAETLAAVEASWH